jgi:hypothetical protein
VRKFPIDEMLKREFTRGEPWDIGLTAWLFDFPDPFDVLNLQFDRDLADQPTSGNVAHFDNSMYNRRLHAAARLAPLTISLQSSSAGEDVVSVSGSSIYLALLISARLCVDASSPACNAGALPAELMPRGRHGRAKSGCSLLSQSAHAV